MQTSSQLVTFLADRIQASAVHISNQWQHPQGTRTRRFVVDDLFPLELCQAAFAAFPQNSRRFLKRDSFCAKQRTTVKLEEFDPGGNGNQQNKLALRKLRARRYAAVPCTKRNMRA